MDLRWWPIALAGLGCLIAVVTLAVVLPMTRVRRRLRPLAHVDRLTKLPEFARIRRRETVAAATTGVLLLVLFGTALLTAARPSGSGRDFDALHPEDLMLCVGTPVTEPTTAALLNHFARKTGGYDAQRIGVTSPTVRVLPLTRDYQYATGRLADYGQLATRPQPSALLDEFARSVPYVDYAPNLRDILALCMSGFPGTNEPSTHRRSLIYLGPSAFGDAEQRSLFTEQQITEMADKAGIQVNVVARVDVTDVAQRGDAALAALAEHTGGRFFHYRGSGSQPESADPTLTASLDTIADNPAPLVLPGGTRIAGQLPDDPNPLLIVALGGCVLLCVAVAVWRR